jgi:predicted RNase H-like nuclease
MQVLVAGADGCRTGWVVVKKDLLTGTSNIFIIRSFAEVIATGVDVSILGVDIPIGLREAAIRGGRNCDILARKILGPPRASSIFPPPVRPALAASSYPEALLKNRDSSPAGIGISRQCYGLFPKFREVDKAMTPKLQERVREVHPELCFFEMNGGKSLPESKTTPEGLRHRLELIRFSGFLQIGDWLHRYPNTQVAPDDVLDACAACWTAERIHRGIAKQIPVNPEMDTHGLRMEMWA